MRLQDLNWMDVARYLEQDNRIILVAGATEQHGYLSLLCDALIPARIAEAVGQRESVLVAPPLNFGFSHFLADFPGTITLTKQTFDLVLTEMVESLLQQGFTRFCVINGHSGNHLPRQLSELMADDQFQLVWFDWWRCRAVKDFEIRYHLRLEHGNWGENFPFTRVGDVPENVKPRVNLDLLVNSSNSPRNLLGDGSYGGPYSIDDRLMDELFAAVVVEAATLVRALAAH